MYLIDNSKIFVAVDKLGLGLLRMDLVILDELGYLPFSQAGGALLFHLLSKLAVKSWAAPARWHSSISVR